MAAKTLCQPVRIDDDVSGGGELRDGSEPPTYDVWVRNANGQDVIRGTATIKPEKEKAR